MRRHLHLLHALRCFDAAARHLSFTKAASELLVTQAAVSHQIRLLEEALGLRVFDRLARSVMLTPAGAQLARTLAESFSHIDASVERLVRSGEEQSLQLAVTPGFCCRWLIPRLQAFRERRTGFELHLHQVSCLETIAWGQAEAAVVWSAERPALACAHRLFGTALTPVFAPGLVAPGRRLDTPAALRNLPLLHEDGFDEWERWMSAAGMPEVPVRRGQIIDDCNALISAAVAGQGVALGRLVLIEDDLRLGRLVAPFGLDVDAEGAYWLVAGEPVGRSPRFTALYEFLQDEAANQARPAVALARAA